MLASAYSTISLMFFSVAGKFQPTNPPCAWRLHLAGVHALRLQIARPKGGAGTWRRIRCTSSQTVALSRCVLSYGKSEVNLAAHLIAGHLKRCRKWQRKCGRTAGRRSRVSQDHCQEKKQEQATAGDVRVGVALWCSSGALARLTVLRVDCRVSHAVASTVSSASGHRLKMLKPEVIERPLVNQAVAIELQNPAVGIWQTA